MRKLFCTACCLLAILCAGAQTPVFEWVKTFGGDATKRGNNIETDATGNIYITGSFRETADFDPGSGIFYLTATTGREDLFICKLDKNGNFAWAKSIPVNANSNLAVDISGNIYVVGCFSGSVDFDPGAGDHLLSSSSMSDMYVLKLSAAGDFLWVKQLAGEFGDYYHSITTDSAHNVYVTGGFKGSVDFSPDGKTLPVKTSKASQDIFVLKLDLLGNCIWVSQMEASTYAYTDGITIDKTGNINIIGKFNGTVDFDPGSGLIEKTTTNFDAYMCQLNADGEFSMLKIFICNCYIFELAIAKDLSENIYVGGNFWGTIDADPGPGTQFFTSLGQSDMFLLKLNANADLVWAKQFSGYSGVAGQKIKPDTKGNVYTSGSFYGYVDFDPDTGKFFLNANISTNTFISKLDPAGNFLWAGKLGGNPKTSVCYGNSFALDAANNIYTLGYFRDTVDFDPGEGIFRVGAGIRSDVYSDVYIHKMSMESPGMSIHELGNNTAVVYPNPTSGLLYVVLPQNTAPATVEIYNSQGSQVKRVELLQEPIDLAAMAPGLYLVKVFLGKEMISTKKIIKQ